MNYDVIEFLESLVQHRFSMEQLNKKVSEFFGEDILIENNTQIRLDSGDYDTEDDLTCDFNLMFNVENGTDQSGFYDIYMLPMRRAGFDNANMYITEVAYEFI